jgi:hypothetical protein
MAMFHVSLLFILRNDVFIHQKNSLFRNAVIAVVNLRK